MSSTLPVFISYNTEMMMTCNSCSYVEHLVSQKRDLDLCIMFQVFRIYLVTSPPRAFRVSIHWNAIVLYRGCISHDAHFISRMLRETDLVWCRCSFENPLLVELLEVLIPLALWAHPFVLDVSLQLAYLHSSSWHFGSIMFCDGQLIFIALVCIRIHCAFRRLACLRNTL